MESRIYESFVKWSEEHMKGIVKAPKNSKQEARELLADFGVCACMYKFVSDYETNIKVIKKDFEERMRNGTYILPKNKEQAVINYEEAIMEWLENSKEYEEDQKSDFKGVDFIWDVHKFLDDYEHNISVLDQYEKNIVEQKKIAESGSVLKRENKTPENR